MNLDDLKRLQAHRAFPALSLRVPTHRKMPEAMQDPTRLKNLIRQAEKALKSKEVATAVVQDYVQRLEHFHQTLDYRHLDRGLCVFVAESLLEWVPIPEEVEETVVVADTFLTRDLVRVVNRQPRFRLLVLSEKATRFFTGWGRRLTEVTGGGFPAENAASEEPPEGFSRGVDPKGHANERLRVYLRQVAQTVSSRLNHQAQPLFIAGVDRLRSFYMESIGNNTPVAGQVEGNFDHTGDHALLEALTPELDTWLRQRRQKVLNHFDEVKGTRHGLAGLHDVGRAAAMGRVETLLVENQYAVPGTLDRKTGEVREDGVNPGDGANDLVDEVVETVMERGGDVVFYREGRLAPAGAPVGAILRY